VEQVWRLRVSFYLGWVPQVWPMGVVAFGPRAPISGLGQPRGLWLGWQGLWLVAGALATWGWVASSSPQIPGHSTSTCEAGVKKPQKRKRKFP